MWENKRSRFKKNDQEFYLIYSRNSWIAHY